MAPISLNIRTKINFPGGPVVKNLPANAGDWAIPKTPHGTEQLVPQLLSTGAATIEARTPRTCALEQEKPAHGS